MRPVLRSLLSSNIPDQFQSKARTEHPLIKVQQSPRAPDFVQDPYVFYERARALGDVVFWEDYGMPAVLSHDGVMKALRDRRLSRLPPQGLQPEPAHLKAFGDVEAFSLLNLEPPEHTRLRSKLLRLFTTARVAALVPEIEALCHTLIDGFPAGEFDLMSAYCGRVPVTVIAGLLGVDLAMCDRLLEWSHAIVGMYQVGRSDQVEARAEAASSEFIIFINHLLDESQPNPGTLLAAMQLAEANRELTRAEVISTAILLLNAGHEASVNALGNAVPLLLAQPDAQALAGREQIAATVEEVLRFAPPLHIFRRFAIAPVELAGVDVSRGVEVACVLASANRDPRVFSGAGRFDPYRVKPSHTSFGAGIHFCLGAPLARLELQIALRSLVLRCPNLVLCEQPRLSDSYHFHGFETLMVRC